MLLLIALGFRLYLPILWKVRPREAPTLSGPDVTNDAGAVMWNGYRHGYSPLGWLP